MIAGTRAIVTLIVNGNLDRLLCEKRRKRNTDVEMRRIAYEAEPSLEGAILRGQPSLSQVL